MYYAIVKSGGKQYKVEEGNHLFVDKLPEVEAGTDINLEEVLFASKDGAVTIGKPIIAGSTVSAKVIAQTRAPKVLSFKRRAKKGYKRLIGHRQYITKLEISKINVN
ncbi:MAG: 50S ribosomal protein L21 [Elusimicrobiota bacterium]|jgi:large subunit ribosomal protein L21|nr:50S ribosomal protein L21 [Elusimicrobiota bacterium]